MQSPEVQKHVYQLELEDTRRATGIEFAFSLFLDNKIVTTTLVTTKAKRR